jgi:hypothetical protein
MKQAVRRKFHYIYKITRLDESGKYYIGMHSTDDLDDGYFGSGKLLAYSIKKHGKEKHKKEILEFLGTREALKLREKELVNKELLGDIRCMNLKLGGEGGGKFKDAEHQRKCTEAGKGLGMRTIIERRKVDQNFDHLYRSALSKAQKNFAINNPEEMIKRQKRICLAATSIKSIAKRKLTLASINHQQGEKNSQFGSCWVSNGVKPIKIKKEQLDEYLLNGYSRGRKYIYESFGTQHDTRW